MKKSFKNTYNFLFFKRKPLLLPPSHGCPRGVSTLTASSCTMLTSRRYLHGRWSALVRYRPYPTSRQSDAVARHPCTRRLSSFTLMRWAPCSPQAPVPTVSTVGEGWEKVRRRRACSTVTLNCRTRRLTTSIITSCWIQFSYLTSLDCHITAV